MTLLRQFFCQDFAYKIPVSSPGIQSVTHLYNLKENPNQPDKMSEWVVLDITSFTKTTKKDKILKILKDVSYNRIQSRTKSYHLRPRLMFARFLILTRVNWGTSQLSPSLLRGLTMRMRTRHLTILVHNILHITFNIL